MTADDAPAFRAALRRLEIAYGCPVDSARDPVYFDAVKEFPIAIVIAAADDLAYHHRTTTGRFPITHDIKDRCREFIRNAAAQHVVPVRDTGFDDGTPPMSKQEFFARLDTLRRKLARSPVGRRHSSLIPLSQIAKSLTHPHAVPPPPDSPREREPGEDDLPVDDTPVQPDGAEDDDPIPPALPHPDPAEPDTPSHDDFDPDTIP